jgi:TPR repeat protein
MTRKILCALAIIACTVVLGGCRTSIQGSEDVVAIGFGSATAIDGHKADGEWDSATKIEVPIVQPDQSRQIATLYLMNDLTNFYVAFAFPLPNTVIGQSFGYSVAPATAGSASGEGSDFSSQNPGISQHSYYDGARSCRLSTNGGMWAVQDTRFGGHNDGSGCYGEESGLSFYEFAKPLITGDPENDVPMRHGECYCFELDLQLVGIARPPGEYGLTTFPPRGKRMIIKVAAPRSAVERDDTLDAVGQYNLAVTYHRGRGVARDIKKAVELYTKAANQGLAEAQANLGAMYLQGQGVPKDYENAFLWLLKAATQGNAPAQYNLGAMYHAGLGVPKDYGNALDWYSESAKQDYPLAAYALSCMYYRGEGVPEDHNKAFSLRSESAERGFSRAQREVGYDCLYGRGVPKDYKKAFELLSKAAEQGDANAQTYLGSMYAEGLGVPEDHTQALAWYLKAAEQGLAYAQATAGMLYLFGRGVPHDHKLAYAWSTLAAESGEKASTMVLEKVAPTLSPQERTETKVMVEEIKRRISKTQQGTVDSGFFF